MAIVTGVVCICSRGTVFAESIASIDREIEKEIGKWRKRYSWNKKIPDAQNLVLAEAMKLKPKWIWFVEEDIVVPNGALPRMLNVDADIVAVTYKLKGGLLSHRNINQEDDAPLSFAGLGCTLIKAEVFDWLEKPCFRTDRGYYFHGDGGVDEFHNETVYGGQDIHFWAQATKHDFKKVLVDGECKHLYLKETGRPDNNDGCHKIGVR